MFKATRGVWQIRPAIARALADGAAILSMAADNTKNLLKAELPRHVVPPSGGNASNNPTRLEVSVPHRLKPGLPTW